jgi:hypothetical protein
MAEHEALTQEYGPGNPGSGAESEEPYEATPVRNAPAKSKSASPAATHRPALPREKDGTVCIPNTFLMHYY